jgi:gamma-glutamyl:cysteine ligase YbdK (ATP-grasp superfamily)
MEKAAFPPASRAQGSGDIVDVADLLAELRAHGFDLRRSAVVTYLIETGADRASAYALRSEAAGGGWQATLYGDRSGWVVRLCSRRLLRRDLLADDLHEVERLARAHGASVRGATVEDLLCDDDWQALAMRLEHVARSRPTARVPRSALGAQPERKASALPHSA